MIGGSSLQVARVTVALLAIHSLLASRQMKDVVTRLVDRRYRNGLYRLLYCLQSILMFPWAANWFHRLPDRTLYRFPAPWYQIMRLGQAASLLLVWEGVGRPETEFDLIPRYGKILYRGRHELRNNKV